MSAALQAYLNSLVLFPPDDTASNLDPGDSTKANFPQFGHGSIKLTMLFSDPSESEWRIGGGRSSGERAAVIYFDAEVFCAETTPT